jgi:16S rRNA (guanine1516-N2)-methyltransferase
VGEQAGLQLAVDDSGRWGLRDPFEKRGAWLRPDFLDGALVRRARMTWNSHEPLRRALGAGKGDVWRVVDGTAGLGRDAWMLAAWGHEVTAYERHPVLFWLLGRAALAVPVAPRFVAGDVRDGGEPCDAVYLDPMYPETSKTALPSGELQLLRRLLHDDASDAGLLDAALDRATRRVIVKRPRRAPPLEGRRRPAFAQEGPTTRFDVYLCGSG